MTIGQLRALIEGSRWRSGASTVNKCIHIGRALDIYAGAIDGRNEDEVPAGLTYNVYKRADVASKDALIIVNILRDCA